MRVVVHRAFRPFEMPMRSALPRRHSHSVDSRQIGRYDHRSLPCQQLRRGDQQATADTEGFGDQRRAVFDGGPHAQGYIDAFLDQIDRSIQHAKLDAYRRIALQKFRDQWPDNAVRQRHRAADSHGASRLGLHLCHCLRRCLRGIAHGRAMPQVHLACGRERKAAGTALHQLHSKLRLEVGHPSRKARLGNA